MPITITYPPANTPFGPGYLLDIQSDHIGPVTFPSYDVRIIGSPSEQVSFLQLFSLSSPNQEILTQFRASYPSSTVQFPVTQTDTSWILQVQLKSSTGVVETATQPIKLDVVGGQLALLSNQIASVQSGQNAGLSTLQASVDGIGVQVTSILDSVVRTFLPGISGKIADLILSPNPPLMTRELIGDFEGFQSFQRPFPAGGVNAFGINWEVLSYGSGIGLDESVPVEFETDLLELEQRHTLADSHELTTATARFRFSNGLWLFQPSFPTRINVAIVPSATIRFWWLLAGTS